MVSISNMRDLIQGVVYKVLEGLKQQKEEGKICRVRKAACSCPWAAIDVVNSGTGIVGNFPPWLGL